MTPRKRANQRAGLEDFMPFAKDREGIWHKRPPGDTWDSDILAAVRCHTVCGQGIWSCHVSGYNPKLDLARGERLCKACFS